MFKWLNKVFTKKTNKISKAIDNVVFDQDIQKKFASNNIDTEFLKQLEANLIKADIGLTETQKLLALLQKEKLTKNSNLADLKGVINNQLQQLLTPYVGKIKFNHSPMVILFNGVNGSGKTTSLGKMAHYFTKQNKKILIAACDSFRAAAVEQLNSWAKQVNCKVIASDKVNADPAAIAYQALEVAKKENYDLLLIDTAGRLQNQRNLMDQLAKIVRVLKKLDDTAPHLSLLVIDGTTGQNALKQLEIFQEHSLINGLIVTKLDGTAKGGAIIPMTQKYKVPIYFIGKGEKIDDFTEFNVDSFIKDLL